MDWSFFDEAPEGLESSAGKLAVAFRKRGWVEIPQLVPTEFANELLARAQEAAPRLGAPVKKHRIGHEGELKVPFQVFNDPTKAEETFRRVAHSKRFASVASALLGTPEVRYFRSALLVKKPEADGGQDTGIHQDFPSYSLDRSGSLMMWVALVDVPSEMGTVRFYEGSHKQFGSLGRVGRRESDQQRLREMFADEPISPPLDLKAGDATVHTDLTVHWAPSNSTQEDRWAWAIGYLRNDVLYNGAPYPSTDDLGLEIDQPLDHQNFPLLELAGHSS